MKRVFDEHAIVRNSSIELLKIIAVFLIVISHVTMTLCKETNTYVNFNDYVFPLGRTTTDVSAIVLMLFNQLGVLGNNMFFVYSAWFLAEKDSFSRKKSFSILCMVWGVSFCIFVTYWRIGHYNLSMRELVRQIFPTTLSNNWYMTCYIIFLFIYPYLNKLVAIVEQKLLLRIVLFSSSLWIFATYLKSNLFFTSDIILWVTVYLLMAYLKMYCKKMMSNLGIGILLIIVGISGFVGQVVITDYAGLYIGILRDKVLRWNNHCCPFYIMIAIGSLIIVLRYHFKVRFINYLSSLSLFVYLIHENYLFRTYTRPKIWQYLYTTFGYAHVVLLDLGFSVALFFASLLISAVYKETIQRLVTKISDKLYVVVSKGYGRIERFLLEKIN